MAKIEFDIPEGYIIDKENSTFDTIKLKKKEISYNEVIKELFKNKIPYAIYANGIINKLPLNCNISSNPTLALSPQQLAKVFAINQYLNVAKYLNKKWEPNWEDRNEVKWCIYHEVNEDRLIIDYDIRYCRNISYFKTRKLAEQAIEILGKETIKFALTTNY